jgi:hypothetical protein
MARDLGIKSYRVDVMLGGGVTAGRLYWRRWCVAYIETLRGDLMLGVLTSKFAWKQINTQKYDVYRRTPYIEYWEVSNK